MNQPSSEYIFNALSSAQKALDSFIKDEKQLSALAQATQTMIECLQNGGKIMSCGNGGSLCDAMHFSEELTGRYRKNRKALAAMSLTEPAHMSCVANDFGYDQVFSRQVEGLGKEGDVLLAISTSGNSKNILKACQSARELKMKVIGLTGKMGGTLKDLAHTSIIVSCQETDRIQEIHIKCIHMMIEGIERALFPQHYP